MSKRFIISTILFLLFIISAFSSTAQTQEDFDKKMGEVYSTTLDKKKKAVIAKEMYDIVGKKKELQTYANYYILKTIYEKQIGDDAMAKTCEEKAQKIMNALVGLNNQAVPDTSNPTMAWATYYFPALFRNTDPENAEKALQFINNHTDLKTFSNLTFIAYAFERHSDFIHAKENYQSAIPLIGNDKEEYHSYMYYTNFLTRTGDYQLADDYIRKMETLSITANGFFKESYKSEAMAARIIYYLNVGDYQSYVLASEKRNDEFSPSWHKSNTSDCDPFPGIRFTNSAFGKEMLKEYDTAEKLWKSRDSVNYIWVNCYNKTYPNSKYYPISMYPVFLVKRGKQHLLSKPVSFFIKETEEHYNSYKDFAELSTYFAKATHLGFLGSKNYPELFEPLMKLVKNTKDFRESTTPFSNYAYFSMRDGKFEEARKTYRELFDLNTSWINDIIFTFGEKAFVTYYNAKLKEGYENFHSFVKLAKEKQPALFPELSQQAYNNLLFTKSISLKGTQRRKEAFLSANDPNITKLYDGWIAKKQQLIRQYLKTDDPSGADTANKINAALLTAMQQEVSQLENELTLKAKDFKKYLNIVPPDWKTVRDQLKEGEAAIEMLRFQWKNKIYYSDTSYYAAYIITKNSDYPEVVFLTTAAADLDNKYYKMYKNNIKFKTDDKESFNQYWKPISEKLKGIKKIYFSPDGIYHLINIATLKNQESKQFLLDEMEIQYTTSGADINTTSTTDIRTAVLIGRPTYKINAPQLTTTAKPVTRSYVRGFKEENIQDLPGTEVEVVSIKKELDQYKINTNLLLKEKATEDELYKLHSPGILHIATHGYWSPAGENATDGYRVFNAMANSGLLLSGVVNYYSTNTYPETYDGVLTAYEAQNLDLQNTSLVILSACETSLGHMDAGEGVYGLQRAFRAAGAGSIMTSLWKVDDNATKDFMITFYQQFLKTKNKSAAFITAQKAIKEKYIHPYFWGAFVMMGE
ncbi:MAG: CHAT domain-containing protein [Chitinophagaceae bacterium]